MGTPQSEPNGFCEDNEDELKGLAKALIAPNAVEVAGAASALLLKVLTGSSVAAGAAEIAVAAAFGAWLADTPDARLLAAAQVFKKAKQDREALHRFAALVEPLVAKATGDVQHVLIAIQQQERELAGNQQEGLDTLAAAMWEALDGLSSLELGQARLLAAMTRLQTLIERQTQAIAPAATRRLRQPLHLRIFISSPGDVTEERHIARALIDELPKRPAFKGKLTTEVFAWDDPHASVPMEATSTPQDTVNNYLGLPSSCDLTLVFLWSRIGTPLPANHCRSNGSRYESGTVWELEDAEVADKPVWVYHRTTKPIIEIDDPALAAKQTAFAGVKRFFETFSHADGSIARGFNSYANPEGLREQLTQHLEVFATQQLEAAQCAQLWRESALWDADGLRTVNVIDEKLRAYFVCTDNLRLALGDLERSGMNKPYDYIYLEQALIAYNRSIEAIQYSKGKDLSEVELHSELAGRRIDSFIDDLEGGLHRGLVMKLNDVRTDINALQYDRIHGSRARAARARLQPYLIDLSARIGDKLNELRRRYEVVYAHAKKGE